MLDLGCAKRAAQTDLVDFGIPAACITQDAVLTGCDPLFDPPKCKHALITYKKGCEYVKVEHSK